MSRETLVSDSVPGIELPVSIEERPLPTERSEFREKLTFAVDYLLDCLIRDEFEQSNGIYPESVRREAAREFGHTFWSVGVNVEAVAALENARIVTRRKDYNVGQLIRLTPGTGDWLLEQEIHEGNLEEPVTEALRAREAHLMLGVWRVLGSAEGAVSRADVRERFREEFGSAMSSRIDETLTGLIATGTVRNLRKSQRDTESTVYLVRS